MWRIRSSRIALSSASEEKAKAQRLENDLQGKNQYIQKLESDLKNLWQQYNESQWYLAEEKAKRDQLEKTLKDYSARYQDLESQLNQSRIQLQAAQKELKEEQLFLGVIRAKHLK